MKIGVVGTFIRDRIFPYQGQETKSFGGLFFTVSFLANLADSSVEICPVAQVGEDFYQELAAELSDYPNVSLDGIRQVGRLNTQVQLHYTGPQERYEITTEPMPPVQLEALNAVADSDVLLVNLISGSDLDLASLRAFRRQSKALIYLDFHSHALAIDDDGKRYYRRPDDWQDWIEQVDILQLNEMEACTLADLTDGASKDELIAFGKKILNSRPSVVQLTLAEEGSLLFHCDNGTKHFHAIEANKVDNVVDIIGCGDAFAAGFIVHFLSNRDILEATRFANQVAAENCKFIGSSGVKQIKKRLWQT